MATRMTTKKAKAAMRRRKTARATPAKEEKSRRKEGKGRSGSETQMGRKGVNTRFVREQMASPILVKFFIFVNAAGFIVYLCLF